MVSDRRLGNSKKATKDMIGVNGDFVKHYNDDIKGADDDIIINCIRLNFY